MTEIGKVTIKVTPDTKGFGAKTKSEVEAQLKDGVPVDVKPKVSKGAAARAEAEIDEVARDRHAVIDLDVDQSALDKIKEKIGKAYRDVGQKVIDPSFQSRLNQQLKQTTEAFASKNKMVQDAARQAARDNLANITTRNDQIGQRIETKMELDTAQASLEAAAWRARESIKNLHIKMELDTKRATAKVGLMKLLTGAGEVGGGILSGFNTIAEGAGKAAAGMRIFGVGAGAMLAIATLVPPALALIAGGLLVLPGALAGIITPIATVALGFKGIQKALQNAGFLADGLDKKGKPNGKKTAGELIKELRDTVSSTFEQKLTPVFESATKLIEPLKASLPTVAAGVSDLAKGFFDAVTSQVGMERIQSTIQNIGTALTNAAPGLGSFTNGFINLVEKVSQRFPGVGDAFTKLGTQFDNWITKFTTPDAGGVSDLDRSLTSLHDTWNEIAGLFSSDLIGKGFDFLKDPNFGKSMTDFVKSIRSLVQESLPQLATGFQEISATLKPITDILAQYDKVQKVLDFANPFKQTPKAFNQDTAKGDAQAKLDAAVAEARKNAGEAGGDAAQSYTDQFRQGVNGGVPLNLPATPGPKPPDQKFEASQIIDSFKGAGSLGASADIGVQLSENIKKATDQATDQLNTGLAGLSAAFQTKLAEIGTQSAALITTALQPLQTAPAAVQTAFSAIAGTIQGSFAQVIGSVAQGASQIAVAVGAGFAQVPGVAIQTFSTLSGIAAGGMAGLVTAVVNGCTQAVGALQNFVGQVGALGGQLFAAAQAAGAQVGLGLAAGIAANAGAAVAAAQQLATAVSIAGSNTLKINSPSKVFRDMGYSINEGLADGIQEQGNLPVERLKEILQTVKDVFGDAKGLNLNFNLGGGTSTSGQVGALNSQINQASSNAKDLGTNLNNAMTPVDPLTADGKARLDEITRQLKESQILKDQLKIQKDSAASKEDKKAIQGQLDQINAQDNILKLEQDKLQYAKKYGNEQWNIADALNSVGKSTLDAGFGFAKSNIDQLQSDLGIGGGAITGGANALWDWGTKAVSNFVFNTSNVDDTMSIYQNQANKEARGIS